MKYFLVMFFALVIGSIAAYSQDYKKHTVGKGETVTEVAKKYKVTPYDIYRLNPDSKNGIKENTVLLIPVQGVGLPAAPVKERPTKVANTIHQVLPKETFYSLSKKYNVTEEDIKKANGDLLNEGLKIGQEIIIPIKGDPVDAQVKAIEKEHKKSDTPVYVYHIVETGETKYSIAKEFNITLQLLEELNPEVVDVLPLGYKLKLVDNTVLPSQQETIKTITPGYVIYTVQPKETFYSLSKLTGLSQEEIIALNPDAKEGLKEGMELKLPALTSKAVVPGAKQAVDLTMTLNKTKPKELVLLLPFNLSRIASDSLKNQQELLRSDRFLNMTLDFYAGSLMAIDSAGVLGLPLKVRILDSNESRNGSNVASFKSTLVRANAVVGPFFPANVETTAAMLDTVPVISPLSKEAGRAYKNIFQAVPSQEREREAMMQYLKSKDANIIAIVDAKKVSSRQFLKENYPSVRFVEGTVNEAAVKPLLSKEKMNYVILETESTEMILNSTKALKNALAEYNIQLAVFEKTDKLEHDEAINRLVALKMLYPSVTRDAVTPQGELFARLFKEKNGVFPNQYATRGFDVTLDVILRLFQQQQFKDTMNTIASEQIENKFSYFNVNGGNYNSGVYILYYDEDLTVKEAE